MRITLSILIANLSGFSCKQKPTQNDETSANSNTYVKHVLQVEGQSRFTFPLNEISTIWWSLGNPSKTGPLLTAFSDIEFKFISGTLDESPKQERPKFNFASPLTLNLKPLNLIDNTTTGAAPEPKPKKPEGPQVEAAAQDAKGNWIVQSEASGKLFLIPNDNGTAIKEVTLDVTSFAELKELWEKDSNSRGEGMLLLQNGHVVILKEKKPSLLIEFGPKDATAQGWNPDLFLKKDSVFPQEDKLKSTPETLVALHYWAFDESVEKSMSDMSEIAIGPDGYVYILSEASKVIARIHHTLPVQQEKGKGLNKTKVSFQYLWQLPVELNQKEQKAEGLSFDANGNPWIGLDLENQNAPNVFKLQKLDPCKSWMIGPNEETPKNCKTTY